MSKRQVIVAACMAAVAVALVAGFSSFVAGREEAWKAQQVSLPAALQLAIAATQTVRRFFLLIAGLLVGASFGVVWLVGLLVPPRMNV